MVSFCERSGSSILIFRQSRLSCSPELMAKLSRHLNHTLLFFVFKVLAWEPPPATMRDSSPQIIKRAIATKVQSVNRAPRKRAAFENNTKRRWGLRKSYIGIPQEASCFRLWIRNLGKVWVLRRESHREWKRVSFTENAKLGEAQGPHSKRT